MKMTSRDDVAARGLLVPTSRNIRLMKKQLLVQGVVPCVPVNQHLILVNDVYFVGSLLNLRETEENMMFFPLEH